MPRHIKPPKSINDWGGLEAYLDGTANKHNGLKYKDFLKRIDNSRRKYPYPKTIASEDFNVSPRTFYSWINKHTVENTGSPDS